MNAPLWMRIAKDWLTCKWSLECLYNKWAVTLHSDTLKNCYFDFRGGETLHYTAGSHFKKTHATSEVPSRYILLDV